MGPRRRRLWVPRRPALLALPSRPRSSSSSSRLLLLLQCPLRLSRFGCPQRSNRSSHRLREAVAAGRPSRATARMRSGRSSRPSSLRPAPARGCLTRARHWQRYSWRLRLASPRRRRPMQRRQRQQARRVQAWGLWAWGHRTRGAGKMATTTPPRCHCSRSRPMLPPKSRRQWSRPCDAPSAHWGSMVAGEMHLQRLPLGRLPVGPLGRRWRGPQRCWPRACRQYSASSLPQRRARRRTSATRRRRELPSRRCVRACVCWQAGEVSGCSASG